MMSMMVSATEQCAPMSIEPPSPTPTSPRRSDGDEADADLPLTSPGQTTINVPFSQRRPSGQTQNTQVHAQPLTPLTTSQVNQAVLGKSPLKVQAVAPSPDMARSPAPQESGDDKIKLENQAGETKFGHAEPFSGHSPSLTHPAGDAAQASHTAKPLSAEPGPVPVHIQPLAGNAGLPQSEQSQQLSSPPSTLPGEGGSSDTENKHGESRHQSPRQGLGILLGSSFNNFPVNNETLAEALRYKAEQERTKQEFYRLEHRKRSLDLLNGAIRAGVPSGSLPLLFGSPEEARLVAESTQVSVVPPAAPSAPPAPALSAAQAAAAAAQPALRVQVVNYEDQQRSPARYRTHMHRASTSSVPTFGGARAQPTRAPGQTSPTNIQFHHWRPNQTRDRSNSSPRRDAEKRKSFTLETGPAPPAAQGGPPKQAQTQILPQAATQSGPPGAPGPIAQQQQQLGAAPPIPSPRSPLRQAAMGQGSPASVVAAQNSRRRTTGHARHRSEAAINRHSWYATGRHDEGAAILANMASERSKHDMDFILDMPRSAWPQGKQAMVIGQPGGTQQQGAPIPFPVMPHQGPMGIVPPGQPQPPTPASMPSQLPAGQMQQAQQVQQPTLLPAPPLPQVTTPSAPHGSPTPHAAGPHGAAQR